jgi:hypothetical protein
VLFDQGTLSNRFQKKPLAVVLDHVPAGIVDYDWSGDDFLASFDKSGNIKWSNLGYYAQIATSDGGVIGQSYSGQSYTFDANGNSTGQIANMPVQSWLGFAYQMGSFDQVSFEPTDEALSFWSSLGGNPSIVNPVAVKLQHTRVFIPYGLYNLPEWECTATSCGLSAPVKDPKDAVFRNNLISAVPAWESVMDVRYSQPNSPQNGSYESISMGLAFPASQCLWFYNLQPKVPPGRLPWTFPCQNDPANGVTQKPRIIFVGMCGFTSTMLNDWTVNTNTQGAHLPRLRFNQHLQRT